MKLLRSALLITVAIRHHFKNTKGYEAPVISWEDLRPKSMYHDVMVDIANFPHDRMLFKELHPLKIHLNNRPVSVETRKELQLAFDTAKNRLLQEYHFTCKETIITGSHSSEGSDR